MVFFPDQALRLGDPSSGSQALARGFAAGDASRRTALAEFQSAAESDRATAKAASDAALFGLRREELDIKRGNLGLKKQEAQLKGTQTLAKILTGVANAPDEIFPQVLKAGVETAKRLGVDTSKYEGLSPEAARLQARVDLQALQGFQEQAKTPAENPINVKFADGTIQAFSARSPELQEALKQPGAVEVGLNVQAGSVADLPGKNRQDEIRSTAGAVSRARSRIAKIRESINENRSRAGVAGTLTRFGQRAAGIAVDLVDLGVDVPGVVSDVATDVASDIQSGGAEESVASFFDPSLPQNEVFENSLAYALARARKGTGRLNLQDVANARQDVAVTGLSSVDEVLARLEAVDEEFSEAQKDLRSRLQGESRDTVPTFRVEGGRLVPVE